MTSPRPAFRRPVDDELPDSFEPGRSVAPSASSVDLPKGDVRVASWIAVLGCVVVLLWYFSILIFGGVPLGDFSTPAQFLVWGLALGAFICGIVCLNARRDREFAAVGFIAGIVSLLVNFAIGLPTGLQILF
ncbi:hypothetical protein ACTU3I_01755 [Microbacterium sp. RD1]|uniref:hypothetical protein n=1 Tax=Microbacterium sp. RD1 TaxID=3457313 RepID=UPI003FA557E0